MVRVYAFNRALLRVLKGVVPKLTRGCLCLLQGLCGVNRSALSTICKRGRSVNVVIMFQTCWILPSPLLQNRKITGVLFYLVHHHIRYPTRDQVMRFTQTVMSEYTFFFFVLLIVSATWAIMSLMIAAMLARFKAVSLAENLRLMREKEEVRIGSNKVQLLTYRSIFLRNITAGLRIYLSLQPSGISNSSAVV